MVEIQAQLRTDASKTADGRIQSKENTSTERQEQVLTKAFARDLRSSLADLLAEGHITALQRAGFNVSEPLEDVTPRIIGWLVQIKEPLSKVATLVGPLMGDEDVMATHALRLERLTQAQGTQEVGRKVLPEDTRDVYRLKGRRKRKTTPFGVWHAARWASPEKRCRRPRGAPHPARALAGESRVGTGEGQAWFDKLTMSGIQRASAARHRRRAGRRRPRQAGRWFDKLTMSGPQFRLVEPGGGQDRERVG
jgi:hypothetical protein